MRGRSLPCPLLSLATRCAWTTPGCLPQPHLSATIPTETGVTAQVGQERITPSLQWDERSAVANMLQGKGTFCVEDPPITLEDLNAQLINKAGMVPVHSEILKYLSLHSVSTVAVLPYLIVRS